MKLINPFLTVSGEDLFDEIWKNIKSSVAII
jgi:hypothetical protein